MARRNMDPVDIIPAGDLGNDFLVLSLDQARQIDQFRAQTRLCETDTEKYEVCTQIRDDVLERHTEVQLLVSAYEHIIMDEYVGYKEWKEKKGETRRLPIKTREDAAKWERFADVARGGSEVKSRCIGPLKTVGRYWGAGPVQHYQLASKGVRYCEVIGAAAREVRDLDEAVTKLNRLMLRRYLATGRGLRRLRGVVNPIDQADLVDLKAWSHRNSFDKDKDSLPYRKLAAADLTPGFGFGKFGLMVRKEFAVSLPADSVEAAAGVGADITGRSGPNDACNVSVPGLVPPDASLGDSNFDRTVEQVLGAVLAHEKPKGLSAANENSEDASSTDCHADTAHSSSLGRSQSATPLSSPPGSPLPTLSAAGVPFGNAARGLADISPPADSDADACRLPKDQSFRQILRSRATSADKSSGRTAITQRTYQPPFLEVSLAGTFPDVPLRTSSASVNLLSRTSSLIQQGRLVAQQHQQQRPQQQLGGQAKA
ncbi:hypothetical protein RB597_003168 [Gaeumannomyces tritici]